MGNGKQGAFAMIDTNLGFTQIGLTKREYFAGLALQGMLSNQGLNSYENNKIISWSVDIADALLKELEDESNTY
jgi:hypothetical protein